MSIGYKKNKLLVKKTLALSRERKYWSKAAPRTSYNTDRLRDLESIPR
jgi:hypothetical protein